jgi:hypothetical protein
MRHARSSRTRIGILLGIACLPAACQGGEWMPLVGDSLAAHWTTAGAWELLPDGVIHLPNRDYKHWKHYENYLILRDTKVADFEFECEWKTTGNSGIYFHIPDLDNLPERQHVEVQIYENSLWTKPDLGDHAAGGVIPGHAPTKNACRPAGEWNLMRLRCVGNQLTVTLNDEVVNRVDLNQGPTAKRSTSGGFAFQDHGFEVWLRNIRLRSLDD